MPKINIEYTENDIKQLIIQDLEEKMPGKSFEENDLSIKVMSKQNYRVHEWEHGYFKAEINAN